MFTYILGAVSVIGMCSLALGYILVKYNMVNSNSLVTIGTSTIMGSLFLPVIKALFLKLSAMMSVIMGIIISSALFLFLIFCINYVVSIFILDIGLKRYIDFIRSVCEERLPGGFLRKKEICSGHGHNRVFAYFKYGIAGLGSMTYASNMLLPVELKPDVKDIGDSKNLLQKRRKAVKLLEEPVEEENVERYIEKAFDLKGTGLVEEALLYYRKILDLKPENELAVSIYIEICSIYKELGQQARVSELLEEVRDFTKPEVLEAIERNVA